MELVYCKNYFNLTKIFDLRLFKMTENQSFPGLNKGLSLNFWCLWSFNYVEFTKECVMCMEEHILIKRVLMNGLNMGLPLWSWVEKIVHGLETHWLSGKEKVPSITSKEGHSDSLLGHERIHHYWFLWKRYNCKQFQLLKQNSPYLLNGPCILELNALSTVIKFWLCNDGCFNNNN